MKKLLVPAMLGLFVHAGATAAAAPVQSQASYEAAITNMSTSPAYVLVEVGDSGNAAPRPVCTTANFLLGAIHREYGLGYAPAESEKALQIARQHADHVFRFQRQAALDNVGVQYTEADLAAARALLAPLADGELKARFSSLYAKARLPTQGYATDALACALIERGFSPRMADRSGQVFIGG
ncbi:hypothetical protein [Herbaspirillum sp. SJZ107]|uniref:hypothetical protein n=1 Tax=Herbaspirillum sp. SJZ107 TaxID=2572881 RepID=UPI001150B2B7|nr:hypothetical protein [Herbaspirillum sp. SJZ107]TQK11019.1 hypothetical protein FBX97_0951 [Herbaspirillum sp. SJZ107]